MVYTIILTYSYWSVTHTTYLPSPFPTYDFGYICLVHQ